MRVEYLRPRSALQEKRLVLWQLAESAQYNHERYEDAKRRVLVAPSARVAAEAFWTAFEHVRCDVHRAYTVEDGAA